jgi:hypothetical protein
VRPEPADVVEVSKNPSTSSRPTRILEDSAEFTILKRPVGTIHMYCTIRRYEAIDQTRASELVKQVDDTLLPRLSKLPGFSGYHLVDAGNGVMSSVSFFETSAQADESTRVAADWVREEKLEKALPNAPKITSGEVVAHKTRELVTA